MPFKGIHGGSFKLLDGHEIPLVGLGTFALRSQEEVNRSVDAALAAGYRLFDTANFYSNERELGNAFKKFLPKHGLKREDIFIITKANMRAPDIEENARQMVQHSLNSLLCSFIDLQLIHYPKDWSTSDKNPKNAENRLRMYRVFEQYKDDGLIRSIGVSNFEGRHIDELWDKAKHRPVANQCEFHPHLTRSELRDYCHRKGIFFQAHTSLATHSKALYSDPTLVSIADKYGASVPQVLLAFAHQQNVGVIPKSGNVDRIKSNISFLDTVHLNSDEIVKLNSLDERRQYSDCDGWNVP